MFLWFKHGAGAPVVDVAVLYDDEPAPEGFTKITKDLTKGVDARVFLAFRRLTEGEDKQPIADLRILVGDDTLGARVVSCVSVRRRLSASLPLCLGL